MKQVLFLIMFCIGSSLIAQQNSSISIPSQDDKLWYDKPAEVWTEALPLGNSYMGAMVFGGTIQEHLQLNESTLYSGDPKGTFKSINIRKYFRTVDSLLKKGLYLEAQNLIHKEWLGRNHQSYQPMGDLWIDFDHKAPVTAYKRSLDLSTATTFVEYQYKGTRFTREYFMSYPDHALVMKLNAQGPEKINGKVYFSTPHTPTTTFKTTSQQLIMNGKVPGFVVRRTLPQIQKEGDQYKYPEIFDKDNAPYPNADRILYGADANGLGMSFDTRLKILKCDGKITYEKDHIQILNATEIVIVLSAASSYNGFDKSPATEGLDASKLANGYLNKATSKNFTLLKQTHLADYQRLFNRVKIQIEKPTAQSALTTDQRIMRFKNGQDPSLAALHFQFGRYLMIAGSRPGGQPLNLQGIWNDQVIPPWNGAYTTNINAQMNYWPAELTNLSECQEPFFRAIKELSINGNKTAQTMYGNQGWVGHHNMDIWRHAEPIDICNCSFWPMAAGWFVSHLWEHYLFTGNVQFLRNETFPLLKGAVLFYKDWLVPNAQGYLVTPMGHSPEHNFKYDGDKIATFSQGPTMDMAIIRESFERYLEATKILNIQDPLALEIADKLKRLLPYQIGKYGHLQEWSADFEDSEKEHRHISHLYAFYPSNQINPITTPELAAAVSRTMERRGDKATGWSMGWKLNVQARLYNGDKAYTLLSNLLTLIKENDRQNFNGSTYPNLFDSCPPFQIDGNFGATAGIVEMLVQSHAGEIHLLPALPKVWNTGKITGLKARGGFIIDLEWEKGLLKTAKITSTLGGNCRIRTSSKAIVSAPATVVNKTSNPNSLFNFINPGKPLIVNASSQAPILAVEGIVQEFKTEAGKNYTIHL
ncbi:glycoside hydrolase family 95 protein [Runella zeae]|uniref:glycoside hydrolase family 95 protein n=1 Tax=Runella zeae TaxID=94255 RepID=UPI00235597B6|nr:glycoside hydrolase family 95 protein [Runella zeae]